MLLHELLLSALYIFCGEHLLCSRLRPSISMLRLGTVEELQRIVAQIRAEWPEVKITVRGDSGFCRDEIMSWCEGNEIDYVFGFAKNERLKAIIASELQQAQSLYEETKKPARVFKDFRYETRESWTREPACRRESRTFGQGIESRFIVTSIGKERIDARTLYEGLYCGRVRWRTASRSNSSGCSRIGRAPEK